MKKLIRNLVTGLILSGFAATSMADVTIGITLPLTGPASSPGIQSKKVIDLWPKSISGEKLNLIILDDATDPTLGVKNTRRFLTEDKVDLIVGSVASPTTNAMTDVVADGQTVHLALSPLDLPEGKGTWSYGLPQLPNIMALPIVDYWKKTGVKTYAFLGWADAYGESWLKAMTALADKAGIKNVATERFARADTSVTGQALKVVGANPDAILIVAAGSGSAMPHKALVERGYAKNKIFQTHGAGSIDLIRLGGKDVEGSFLSGSPAIVAKLLPDSNPSKAIGVQFIKEYEAANGPNSATAFAAHTYDVAIVLQRIIPMALKKAKPGTKEFRLALKEAIETMGRTPVSHGVLNYTVKDHGGFTPDTGMLLTIVNGTWALASAPTK